MLTNDHEWLPTAVRMCCDGVAIMLHFKIIVTERLKIKTV